MSQEIKHIFINLVYIFFVFQLHLVEMVDAITGFVVGKMGNYLIEEASILMGIKDELEELKAELTCIRGYLKDVEAREREDEVSKEWTKLVLDIAYDVEDVLDSYNLKVELRSQRQGLIRLTNKIGEKIDAYNIVSNIKTVKREESWMLLARGRLMG